MINMKLGGAIMQEIKKWDKHQRQLVSSAVKEASTIVWGKAVQNTPVGASGMLRKGIRRELSDSEATIQPSHPYALAVHDGTKPHAVAKEALREGGALHRWAKKRGLNPYAVANAIKRKGTKANPFFKDTIEQTQSEVQSTFERVLGKTVRDMAGE